MDFYCLKFDFQAPTLSLREARGGWEVAMTIGESRLGTGFGPNKKVATANSYMDVLAYLDQSDPKIWNTFLEETKGRGDAIGLAHPIYANIAPRLAANMRDLNREIVESELYRNSPVMKDTPFTIEDPSSSTSLPRYPTIE